VAADPEIRRLAEGDAQAVWDLRRAALRSEPEAFGESLDEHLQRPVEAVAGRLRSGGDQDFVLASEKAPSAGFQPYGLEPQALRVDGRFIDEAHMRLQL
jgi:hypothetical protein